VTAGHKKVATTSAEKNKRKVHRTASPQPAAHRLRANSNDGSVPHLSSHFSPGIAPFPVQLNGERLVYQTNSVFALPAEKFLLEVGGAQKKNAYVLETALSMKQIGLNTWSWQAPRETGLYPVKILQANGDATIALNFFVMIPFSRLKREYLNGYRIGHYPRVPFRQLAAYNLPRGFIEVTRMNENALVSPHFRLQQFLCKQDSGYPKYLVLDPRLLVVLESILRRVNDRGYHCPTLEIMSGYRTPHYNRAIGNSTTYSRHLWGDAADIFIDTNPRDGEMDDLNRDGVVNFQDTKVLYNIVHDLYAPRVQRFLPTSLIYEPPAQGFLAGGFLYGARVQRLLTGGLARYRETDAHGPFVHVDVRGVYTTWGR
jgi:hypothetical protein